MSEAQETGQEIIQITMFGKFSLKLGDCVFTDDIGKTKKLWTLLEYLIAYRNTQISQEKLIEVLWGEEDCDNPANALKNLIYRLRNLLASFQPEGQSIHPKTDYIVFKRNAYSWNNELPCWIDTEDFESSYKSAKDSSLPCEERIRLFKRATSLYKGEFLPKSSMQDWVIANSVYYKNMYIEAIKGLCELLHAEGSYEEAALVCEKAASIEPFDESIHGMIISSYLGCNQRQKAIQHYEHVSEMFYEKLGIKISDNISKQMRQVYKTVDGVERDFSVIETDLVEGKEIEGAYFCNYEVFKSIYRVEARLAERFGQSVFVALLTIEHNNRSKQQDLSEAMQMLKVLVISSLRKSDVVSRYSNTQFILMLPSLTYENGLIVLNRIIKRFGEQNKNRNIWMTTKLNPLVPIISGSSLKNRERV